MCAKLLNGAAIAKRIKDEVAEEVKNLTAFGVRPGLAAVLVGDNPASRVYVSGKSKACEAVGVYSEKHELPAETTTEQLLELVRTLNDRDEIDGILVQLPLPAQIDSDAIIEAVSPLKDVDGFHPESIGRLALKQTRFAPCTPAGIMEILERSNIDVKGKHAVVLGRSRIVGMPMALLLIHADATVTIAHSKTRNIAAVAREADILIAAIGRAAFVTEEFIKPGAVVIDVGINRLNSREDLLRYFPNDPKRLEGFESKGSTLVGDVDPRAVSAAEYFTPVPGGVGPLTIAMLIKNTVKAARMRRAFGCAGEPVC
jgi:methylenetetrahydrofolate dehydrogenase (NADP+) / methenyltetrahydrofolate cyclohydrolase